MKRSGFTLLEMVLVLLIMGIIFAMVVPSMASFGNDPEEGQPWKEFVELLRSSRSVALENAVTVKMVLDPHSGLYRVDSNGARGAGMVYEGSLQFAMSMNIESDSSRAKFSFHPDGSAFADSLIFRSFGYATKIWVNPFSGKVIIEDR